MTQEEKDLLLKDLCARLPYGVICDIYNVHCTIKERLCFGGIARFVDDTICVRPYLFPLSSMTEEQYYEMMGCSSEDCLDHMEVLKSLRECTDFTHWPLYEYRVIDWFHKNHFDYRGLIDKGLAIDATSLNIY